LIVACNPFHGSCAHVNPDSTNEKIERKALEQVADKNLILYICLNPQMDREMSNRNGQDSFEISENKGSSSLHIRQS